MRVKAVAVALLGDEGLNAVIQVKRLRRHWFRVPVTSLLVMVVVGLAGCGGQAVTASAPAEVESAGLEARSIDASDFREWATKNASLAEAEEFLGVPLPEPAETLGRDLVQVYTLQTYSDGSPVARTDQAAILDYGDFTVGFIICGSADAAQTWVEGHVDDLGIETGLGEFVTVDGRTLAVRTMGTVPMQTDASGKTTREGLSYGANVVSWARGDVCVSFSSTVVSSEDLLEVAMSIDD